MQLMASATDNTGIFSLFLATDDWITNSLAPTSNYFYIQQWHMMLHVINSKLGKAMITKTTAYLSAKIKEIMFEISQSSLQGGHWLSILADIIWNC